MKENQLKDAAKKPVESPASRCVGIEYTAARTVGDQALRVGDKTTETIGIEGDHCQGEGAVAINAAAAHAFKEGYTTVEGITVEKQGEVARVSKCRGHGGQRPRKFLLDLHKIWSKICKKSNFWYVCTKFEL